jgi:hypothetical protein
MSDSAFEQELAEAFAEMDGVDEETARSATEKAASFREDYDEDLTAEDVISGVRSGPYEAFRHNFDFAVGDFAADNEDCTDSRPYRLSGFGDLAANPEQGA